MTTMTREEAIAGLSIMRDVYRDNDSVREALTLALSALSGNADGARDDWGRLRELYTSRGWVLVPREPTTEMCRAGLAERHDDLARSIYRAMLSAAPQPTTAVPTREGE
jgi:hypothetical protein